VGEVRYPPPEPEVVGLRAVGASPPPGATTVSGAAAPLFPVAGPAAATPQRPAHAPPGPRTAHGAAPLAAAEQALASGYYPAIGFPPGTVVIWDGQAWHGPVTVPGYYGTADGAHVWWNGNEWCPDVVACRPPPAPRPRQGPAHRRPRPQAWQAVRATLLAVATLLVLVLVAHVR
jgi:hypothetical protein